MPSGELIEILPSPTARDWSAAYFVGGYYNVRID
jgi:hypothetical protein